MRSLRELIKRLEGRPLFKKVLFNTSWLFADRMVRMAVSMLVGAWVARYLGPERYGALNYAIAFTAIFGTLATLGLDGIVVRDLVLHPDRQSGSLGTTLWLRVAGGLLCVLICSVSVLFLKPDDGLARFLVVLLAVATVFQGADTVDMWFQAEVRTRETVPYKLAALGLASAARVGLVLWVAPLWAFGVVIFAEAAFNAAALWLAWRRQGSAALRWRWSGLQAARLLKDSWPLAVSSLAIYVQARVDQVMLGQLLGARPLGLYSAAGKVAEVFNFVPMLLISAAFPAITLSKKEGHALYERRMLDVYRLMAILTVAVGLPVTLFSGLFIRVLFGKGYAEAAPILAFFIWTRVYTNYGVARSLFITHEGLFRFALVTALLGSVCNIALNLWWIPLWGPYGAIAAFSVSFGINTFLVDWAYKPSRRNFYLMLRSVFTFHKIFREELQ